MGSCTVELYYLYMSCIWFVSCFSFWQSHLEIFGYEKLLFRSFFKAVCCMSENISDAFLIFIATKAVWKFYFERELNWLSIKSFEISSQCSCSPKIKRNVFVAIAIGFFIYFSCLFWSLPINSNLIWHTRLLVNWNDMSFSFCWLCTIPEFVPQEDSAKETIFG